MVCVVMWSVCEVMLVPYVVVSVTVIYVLFVDVLRECGGDGNAGLGRCCWGHEYVGGTHGSGIVLHALPPFSHYVPHPLTFFSPLLIFETYHKNDFIIETSKPIWLLYPYPNILKVLLIIKNLTHSWSGILGFLHRAGRFVKSTFGRH